MVRKLFLLVLMFLLLFGLQNVYAVTIQNESIKFAITQSDGRFTIGTAGGKRLIYGFPSEGSTSFSSVNIDGVKQQLGNGTNKTFSSNSTSATYTEDVGGVRISQILQIVKGSSTGLNDNVSITYKLKNIDSISHSGGIRIYIDTMIGSNDAAPYRVNNNAVITETEYVGNNIPDYFQAFDSLNSPTLMAQGTVKNTGYYTPDRFLIGNYGRFSSTVWDYTASIGSSNGDSAIAVYWNPKEILPGEEVVYTFVYGLSGVDANYNPPLSFSISGPKELGVTGNGSTYSPDPFTIVAYISNVTNGSTSHNTKVTLDLTHSPNLEIDPNDTLVKNLGDISYPNEVQVTWKVKPKIAPGNTDITQTYKIKLESDDVIDTVSGLKTKELSRDIVLLNKDGSIDYNGGIASSEKSKYKNTPPKAPTDLKLEKTEGSILIKWTDPSETQPYNIFIEKYINGVNKGFLTSVNSGVGTYTDTSVSSGNIYSYKVYAMNIGDLQSNDFLFGNIDFLNEHFVDIINPKPSPTINSQFINVDFYIGGKINSQDKITMYVNDKLVYNTGAILGNHSISLGKATQVANKLKLVIVNNSGKAYTTKFASKEIFFNTTTINLNSKLDISFQELSDNVIYKVKYIYGSTDYSSQIAKVKVYDKKTAKLVGEFSGNTGRETNPLKINYTGMRTIEAFDLLGKLIDKQDITINTKKLEKIELRYKQTNNGIDWSWNSIPEVEAYWFQCKDESGANIVNAGKLKDNSITTEIFKKSVICKVKAFVDGSWQYESDEVVIGNIWKITKEMAYKDFLTIYGFTGDFDKEALRLGIIGDLSEKDDVISWNEYGKDLFKIFGAKGFTGDKVKYDKFVSILVEAIELENEKVTKEDYEDIKDFVSSNDLWKSRVELLSKNQDKVIELYNNKNIQEKLLDVIKSLLDNNEE